MRESYPLLAIVSPAHPPSRLSPHPRSLSLYGTKVAQASVYGVLPGSVLEVAYCRNNHNHTVYVMEIHIWMEEYNMASHQGATATTEHKTGVKDEVYNVVSVLYHALRVVRLLCSISRMPKGWRSETGAVFPGSAGVPSAPGHSPRTYWRNARARQWP